MWSNGAVCCLIYTTVISLLTRQVYASSASKPSKDIPQTSLSDAGPLNVDGHLSRRSEHGTTDSDWPSKVVDGDSSSTLTEEAGDPHDVLARSKCCYRQRKFHTIGFDTTARKPMRKDVGRCRRTYVDEPARTSSSVSPRELVRRRRRHGPLCDQPCDDGNVCLPTRVLLERSLYANAWSPLDYEVIDDCQCVPKVHPCERVPLMKVFHHDTPHQTAIDVGECRGRCYGHDSGLTCRATKNKTETVIGPNGHECVDVVTGCSCTRSCFRGSHLVAFYIRKFNETTGKPYDAVQEMDIGKCVGSCSERKGICIRHTNCEAILVPNTYCSPKEYVPHMFQGRDGKDLTVHVINECRCI